MSPPGSTLGRPGALAPPRGRRRGGGAAGRGRGHLPASCAQPTAHTSFADVAATLYSRAASWVRCRVKRPVLAAPAAPAAAAVPAGARAAKLAAAVRITSFGPRRLLPESAGEHARPARCATSPVRRRTRSRCRPGRGRYLAHAVGVGLAFSGSRPRSAIWVMRAAKSVTKRICMACPACSGCIVMYT
jgi:hypothetical protein